MRYESNRSVVPQLRRAGTLRRGDLAFPGVGEIALDALRGTQTPSALGAKEPHRDDRCRPHRPRYADIEHLLCCRHAQSGKGRQLQRLLGQNCERSSSPRSSSSARRKVFSTTAPTSSRWLTKRVVGEYRKRPEFLNFFSLIPS